MEGDLFILAIIAGGAAVIPFVARRVRIPSAILEILFGMAVFSVIMGAQPEWFTFLKEVGLVYLMFIAGMELDLRALLKGGRFLWYLVIALIPFVIMPLVFIDMGMSFYLGIAVSMASAGIMIPVLKESQLMRSPMGRDALGLALTGEFLSITALTGMDVYRMHGISLLAALQWVKLLLLLGMAIIFLRLLYVVAWWNPERVEKVMESEDPVEEGIRAVIFVALTGALIAIWSGVEPILGSFMSGLIFSQVFRSKGRFEEKINAVGFGFFTPLFFIGVGADFHIGLLASPSSVLLGVFLAVMMFAANLPVLLLSGFMKMSKLDALGSTLLLSAPLSMLVVSGTLGVRMGFIEESLYGPVILASIISGLVYPILFRPIGRRILKRLEEAGKDSSAKSSQRRSPKGVDVGRT